jgi:hypothetical protein
LRATRKKERILGLDMDQAATGASLWQRREGTPLFSRHFGMVVDKAGVGLGSGMTAHETGDKSCV